LILVHGKGAELAAQDVKKTHESHERNEQKKDDDLEIRGLTMDSIRKEGKMKEIAPGSLDISPERQQLIGVKIGAVEKKRLEKVIRTTGRVDYDEKRVVIISPKIGGWIEELYADFTGAMVRKGDPLLTLYSPDLVSTQEEYLLALQAREGLLRSPFPEVARSGQSLADSARQRLKLWDISDEQIRTLEETRQPRKTLTLYSPYNGFVVEKMAFKGMNVAPGMSLFKLADLSVVWVYADIYEYELPLIRLGQSAAVKLSYLPDSVLTGKAIYIYPALDPKTRTAKVRFEFPNPRGVLKPDMYAEISVTVVLGERLVVPEGAVIDTGIRQVAIVQKGAGYFEPREVKLGVKVDDYYELVSGLVEGERVVTSANFLIDSESKFKEAVGGAGGEHGAHGK
jgi:Cu(I)/Ag(I) efflux system membrane fusion protein